jgi:hypothetical protein
MKTQLTSLNLILAAAALLALPAKADLVNRQRQALPELRSGAEGAHRLPAQNLIGKDRWKKAFEQPESVPVNFMANFSGGSPAGVTLTMEGVSTNASSGGSLTPTGQATVRLLLYKTYSLSVSGDNLSRVDAFVWATNQYNLLQDPHATANPGRLYRVWFLDTATGAWTNICSAHNPEWSSPGGGSTDMSTNFLIQVRPDLGVRPAIYSTGGGSPDDQGDDGWTRDEAPMNAATVIGDGDPVSISGGIGPNPAVMQFQWGASMGRLWNGGSAGKIRIIGFGLDTNAAYTPACLQYAARSSDPNEVLVLNDLDDTNTIRQIKVPQGLATADPAYGSPLLWDTNFLDVLTMVYKLTNSSPDLVSKFLWTNFTAAAQSVLTNTSSTLSALTSTIVAQFNLIIQAGAIYDSTRFTGVTLSSRTRRLLLLSPTGSQLTLLNRFLLDDAYPTLISRLPYTSLELKFYAPSLVGAPDSLGYFTLPYPGSNFVTWRVLSPDGSTNKWRMEEVRNGLTNATRLEYTNSVQTWTLTRGSGNDAIIETRAVTITNYSGTTNRIETQEIKNGSGMVCERNTEVYQAFPWGYEMASITNDPGGANLLTQITYGTDTNWPGIASYGQILSITYPDGYWERRTYSTSFYDDNHPFRSLQRTVHPWKDTSITTADNDCLVTDNGYHCFVDAPGGFWSQTWHDAASFSEPDDGTEKFLSEVRAEMSAQSFDDCGSSYSWLEARDLGSVYGEGEEIWSEPTTPAPAASAASFATKGIMIGSPVHTITSLANGTQPTAPSASPRARPTIFARLFTSGTWIPLSTPPMATRISRSAPPATAFNR